MIFVVSFTSVSLGPQTFPSRYVVWGDGTGDGMCLGLLTATAGS